MTCSGGHCHFYFFFDMTARMALICRGGTTLFLFTEGLEGGFILQWGHLLFYAFLLQVLSTKACRTCTELSMNRDDKGQKRYGRQEGQVALGFFFGFRTPVFLLRYKRKPHRLGFTYSTWIVQFRSVIFTLLLYSVTPLLCHFLCLYPVRRFCKIR